MSALAQKSNDTRMVPSGRGLGWLGEAVRVGDAAICAGWSCSGLALWLGFKDELTDLFAQQECLGSGPTKDVRDAVALLIEPVKPASIEIP